MKSKRFKKLTPIVFSCIVAFFTLENSHGQTLDSMETIQHLEKFYNQDNFPINEWRDRMLTPSPVETRIAMNNEVKKFIDFINPILLNNDFKKEEITENIKKYFRENDFFDFDTEETEYILEVIDEILSPYNLDAFNIYNNAYSLSNDR